MTPNLTQPQIVSSRAWIILLGDSGSKPSLQAIWFKHCAAAQDQWASERQFGGQNEEKSPKIAKSRIPIHLWIFQNFILIEVYLEAPETFSHEFVETSGFENVNPHNFNSRLTIPQLKRFGETLPKIQKSTKILQIVWLQLDTKFDPAANCFLAGVNNITWRQWV